MVNYSDYGTIAMMFKETTIKDVYVVELERFEDNRGFFAEGFQRERFREKGLESEVAQTNISYNVMRGVIRGLHFQKAPMAQAKLVRCTRGSIFDVAVDLRSNSPTFKKWVGETLSSDNRKMMYIGAEDLAHGYQALENDTEVEYMTFELWAPGFEGGYRYDDPAFGVEWPLDDIVLSDKDRGWGPFPG